MCSPWASGCSCAYYHKKHQYIAVQWLHSTYSQGSLTQMSWKTTGPFLIYCSYLRLLNVLPSNNLKSICLKTSSMHITNQRIASITVWKPPLSVSPTAFFAQLTPTNMCRRPLRYICDVRHAWSWCTFNSFQSTLRHWRYFFSLVIILLYWASTKHRHKRSAISQTDYSLWRTSRLSHLANGSFPLFCADWRHRGSTWT